MNENLKNPLPKTIEVEGCTVEDAIKRALELLGASREDVTVKIMSEEQKGLFGMEGAKPAKIKVTMNDIENNA